MTDRCIIPADHPIGRSFRAATRDKRILFVAGLPSSGKSLMLQQLTILADQAGRRIHTMQWDAARRAFETPEALLRFPEVDNLTHPGIRKAVGLWVRGAVADWADAHADDTDILIAELPVVAGRFAEFLHPLDDAAEVVLTSKHVTFFVPVPSDPMRAVITGHRADTFANPRNEQETKDAPIHIVEQDWLAARQLHNRWNGVENDPTRDANYSAEIYRAVFEHLLRHRNFEILDVDQRFATTGSAYDRTMDVTEMAATRKEVTEVFARLDAEFPGDAVERAVARWAEV